jgi:GNAT superfamily N-acetyltransferase
MGQLEIRPAGPDDAVALTGLIGGFRDHLRARSPSDADVARALPRALASPAVEFACAWLDGRAAGFTQLHFFPSVWAGGTEARLEDLFVAPDARRRGVGRALLHHALARARDRGAARLTLNTNERNEPAQALYRAEGFRMVSHALFPDGREVLWVRALDGSGAGA